MKPTAFRVKKLIEEFEKTTMNPAFAMIQTAQEVDFDDHYYDVIEDRMFDLRQSLMAWYQRLAEPAQSQ